MKKIVIVAGDKSGDIYGGLLAKQLNEQFSEKIQIYSFAGQSLKENSQQILNLVDHAVSGIFEVLKNLPNIFKTFEKCITSIKEIKPDLIILIDFPDFNLRLAKKLYKDFPIYYYISPQVWAWRKSRVNLIRKYIKKMIVLFKFEEEFYKNKNVDAVFFGHPLLEIIPKINIEHKKIITFLPGSRKNEILHNLPTMIETKNNLESKIKDFKFRLIYPENIPLEFYDQFNLNGIEMLAHSYDKIAESYFVITASGTATLELSLLGVPFCAIYKLNKISWILLKNLVKIDFITLANIVAQEKIVEEFLQDNANAENLTKYALSIINNKNKHKDMKNKLNKIHNQLLPNNASLEISRYLAKILNLSS